VLAVVYPAFNVEKAFRGLPERPEALALFQNA